MDAPDARMREGHPEAGEGPERVEIVLLPVDGDASAQLKGGADPVEPRRLLGQADPHIQPPPPNLLPQRRFPWPHEADQSSAAVGGKEEEVKAGEITRHVGQGGGDRMVECRRACPHVESGSGQRVVRTHPVQLGPPPAGFRLEAIRHHDGHASPCGHSEMHITVEKPRCKRA